MSAMAEQPFDDRELRYFLAEIIKGSSIPPTDLLQIIEERGIVPDWMEIALPNGRSPMSCRRALDLLKTRSLYAPAPAHPLGPSLPQEPASKSRRKRPNAGEIMSMNQLLHPQQYPLPAVNEPNDPSAYQVPPPAPREPAALGEPPEKKQKKRGRPSKAEFDLRVAEAKARGEIYPRPRKPKTPRPSTEGAATRVGPNETGEAAKGSAINPDAQKPLLTPSELQFTEQPPTERHSLEASANAADQMQVDVPEAQLKSTIPETQASEFAAPESLLAGMAAHAARSEAGSAQPETVQSSVTLQQGSVPQ